jgi:cobalt/nickel transport system permease protein
MAFLIAALPCPDSPLRRLDPRWKLAGLVLAAGTVVALQTLPAAGSALAGSLGLACLGRLPGSWVLRRIGTVALLIAPFLILVPFVHSDTGPAWHLGSVQLSVAGARLACLIALKTLTLVMLLLVLLTTSPLTETLKAAQALRVPGVLVQVSALTYRYVFVLNAELARLRLALRVRGYRNRLALHSYRTAGHVAGTLLVRGYERGERVGQAMRCRGFAGRFRSLSDWHTRIVDVAAFLLLGSVALALLVWDLLGR